jgi:hypothetical protein
MIWLFGILLLAIELSVHGGTVFFTPVPVRASSYFDSYLKNNTFLRVVLVLDQHETQLDESLGQVPLARDHIHYLGPRIWPAVPLDTRACYAGP